VDFGILPNHPPPTAKGRMFGMRQLTLLRPAGRWRVDTQGERGQNGDEVHRADAVFVVGIWRKYQFLCSRTEFEFFFGDDHGGEAVVGRRDANWARGNSAVTDVCYYLLFGWWERFLPIGLLWY
jgi:hypothetical protein